MANERRSHTNEFEVRSAGGKTVIEGYASVFNKRSQDLGGFYEVVSPGAFAKTIQEADVRALLNHDPNFVLGRNRSGTLRMVEDGSGLHYEVDLPDTTIGRDLAISMERGDINQSSFGFRMVKDDWGLDENEQVFRTLQEVRLFDVSPVTYPAYLDATSGIGSRALEVLAETRGLDLSVVKSNLAAVIKGDDVEPEGEARTASDPTTPLVIDYPSDAFASSIRARLLGF